HFDNAHVRLCLRYIPRYIAAVNPKHPSVISCGLPIEFTVALTWNWNFITTVEVLSRRLTPFDSFYF
ncbi:MAG: hypothetical protein ABIW48_09050, partial [Burkholderiales bacterium]